MLTQEQIDRLLEAGFLQPVKDGIPIPTLCFPNLYGISVHIKHGISYRDGKNNFRKFSSDEEEEARAWWKGIKQSGDLLIDTWFGPEKNQ